MTSRPSAPHELTVSDPATLRALAHPARQRAVRELYAGEVLTATEAAQLCGLSPSAMSYHLRALEKAGIIERGESADGRERPWRAAADRLSINPEAFSGAGMAATREHLEAWVRDMSTGLERVMQDVVSGSSRGIASSGQTWLTAEEEVAIAEQVEAIWQQYKGRSRRDHPEGASLCQTYLLVLPQGDQPEGNDSDSVDLWQHPSL
ncbi:MAG: helix-turn-helix domain-containing protein [Actinomycetia bacterium]|nr:helix-turn-helix domain-containing protein [Actinomycetes bacterium]